MRKLNSKNKGTDLRRQAIIKAALACFIELGYNNTGISDILKRAGATTGSLYYHFGSKEQLAGEVYLEGIREYQAGFLSVLARESDAEKGIKALIAYHLKWVESNRAWAQYLFRMRHDEFMPQKAEEFSKLNQEFIGQASIWFRQQIAIRAIRRMPLDLYAIILMSPCHEFAREYSSGRTSTDINTAIKALASAAWLSLKRT
jgi:AcrR family transcriptional regulator